MHANKARGVLIAFLAMIVACSNAGGPVKDRRLQVVATVFPLYDFARAIGGEKVFVTMLIPPGTDARDFELTEDDIEAAGKADIFMFASFEMEQWAYKIINAAAEKTNMVAVETGRGAYMLPALSPYGQVRADLAPALTGKDPGGVVRYDPYIWLDFTNAQKMMDNIAAAFINKDPKNAKLYKKKRRSLQRHSGGVRQKIQTTVGRLPHAERFVCGQLGVCLSDAKIRTFLSARI